MDIILCILTFNKCLECRHVRDHGVNEVQAKYSGIVPSSMLRSLQST